MTCVDTSVCMERCAECNDLVQDALCRDALESRLADFAGSHLAYGFKDAGGSDHCIGLDAVELVRQEFDRVPPRCTYVGMCDGVHQDESVHQANNGQRTRIYVVREGQKASTKDAVKLRFKGQSKHRESLLNADERGHPIRWRGEQLPWSRQIYLPTFATMEFDTVMCLERSIQALQRTWHTGDGPNPRPRTHLMHAVEGAGGNGRFPPDQLKD